MRTDRRRFIVSMSALGASALAGLSACDTPLTREDMLSSLVLDLAVPDVQALEVESERLYGELLRLTEQPGLEQLTRAKQQWQRALLCFRDIQVLRTEPVVRTNALLRAVFWPINATAIDAVLSDSRAIDARLVEDLGVQAKGMFALEHLLFARLPAELIKELSLPEGERLRLLLRALAADVLRYAKAARLALGDGKTFAATLAKTGQDGLNELVNSLITSLENVVMRLQLVADRHALGTLKLADVEGGLSESSQPLVLMSLSTCQRAYLGARGRGISALVRNMSPSVNVHMESLFAEAVSGVRELGPSLERAAVRTPARLKRAIELVRNVEVAFRSEVSGVLGVTLNLISGDGD